MGNIESGARKKRMRRNVQKAVLSTVAITGILAVAAAAPNVLQAFPSLIGKQRYKLAFQTRSAIGRLVVKGLLSRDGKNVRLTSKGRKHLEIEEARLSAPAKRARRWDKRFRLVMFDIPQKRRGVRDRLRRLMSDFGFLRLQDSVWVSPYDCEEIVALVKVDLHLGNDVLYAVVDEIGNASFIKQHFNL